MTEGAFERRHRELREAAEDRSHPPGSDEVRARLLRYELFHLGTGQAFEEVVTAARALFDAFDPDDGEMPAEQYNALRALFARLAALDEAAR